MSCRQAGTTTITNFNDAEYDEDADEDYVDDSNSDDSEERSLGSEDSATNSDSDDNETDSEGLESDEADGLGEEDRFGITEPTLARIYDAQTGKECIFGADARRGRRESFGTVSERIRMSSIILALRALQVFLKITQGGSAVLVKEDKNDVLTIVRDFFHISGDKNGTKEARQNFLTDCAEFKSKASSLRSWLMHYRRIFLEGFEILTEPSPSDLRRVGISELSDLKTSARRATESEKNSFERLRAVLIARSVVRYVFGETSPPSASSKATAPRRARQVV